jgi:molybdopterin-guanine dinucleotide biosynthesis protein A
MAGILGVILAGGSGRRLGGAIKANIEVGGISLVDRVAGALAGQCDSLVLSIGTLAPGEVRTSTPITEISDPEGITAGPVSGLGAAVVWALDQVPPPQFLVTAAVDTPFFPTDFVARAMDVLTPDIDCVMGIEGDQPFPTNALWRFSSIEKLPGLLLAGAAPHGLRNVIPSEATGYVPYPKDDPTGCFANINTADDLKACIALTERMRQLAKG